mmetsp:Transcript_16318/g.16436  ORF Transcript_16318/g.16436 Transcript_16318/m.16436 type:complete len:93 (+) Transcript_16318:218-496(+)
MITNCRSLRLSMRRNNEEVLRRKFLIEVKERCKDKFHAFGECAQNNGILVVFNCRKENQAMSDCMDNINTAANFRDYVIAQGYGSSIISNSK